MLAAFSLPAVGPASNITWCLVNQWQTLHLLTYCSVTAMQGLRELHHQALTEAVVSASNAERGCVLRAVSSWCKPQSMDETTSRTGGICCSAPWSFKLHTYDSLNLTTGKFLFLYEAKIRNVKCRFKSMFYKLTCVFPNNIFSFGKLLNCVFVEKELWRSLLRCQSDSRTVKKK